MSNAIPKNTFSTAGGDLPTMLVVAPNQFTPLNAGEIKDDLQLVLIEAHDLANATTLWKANRPRIIILPIFMEGEIVLPFIHMCLNAEPGTQIIVIVNRDQINNAANAMRAGVVDCLFRPFSSERLLKTINRAMLRADAMPANPKAPIQTRARSKPLPKTPEARPLPGVGSAVEQPPISLFPKSNFFTQPDATNSNSEPSQILLKLLKGQTLAEIERLVIEAAINSAGGSVTQAAKALDVAPSTLYRKKQGWETKPE